MEMANRSGNPRQLSEETTDVVRDFVRAAVTSLGDALKTKQRDREVTSRWERGSDGNFRERAKFSRQVRELDEEWLHALPDYGRCVERLTTDPVVGPHCDRLVGTSFSAMRLEADQILVSLVHEIIKDEGSDAFSEQLFKNAWSAWEAFFTATHFPLVTIVPIPLEIGEFPMRLNENIVLDRFTDEEVTRCVEVGVIQPTTRRFPFIQGNQGVGVRKTEYLEKAIRTGDGARDPLELGGDGEFGRRPALRPELVVDDVLSALRLFKHVEVAAAGYAMWIGMPRLAAATSYRVLRQMPHFGSCELSSDEVPQFLELWRELSEGASQFGFSIHRFNLAFDRGLIADRIVDLVIAAESLLLGDNEDGYKAEVRFRFAVRGAKFIDISSSSERERYEVLKRAYDARSAVVHGSSGKKKGGNKKGGNKKGEDGGRKLQALVTETEALVRAGLRKALGMGAAASKLEDFQFWEELMLSNSKDEKKLA